MTNIGGAALPVFLDESNPRIAPCPAMLVYADAVDDYKNGGPATPIKFLAAGDLVENGGPYCVAPGPARKIALAPGAPRSGQRTIPVYPAPGYEWIVDSFRGTPSDPYAAYVLYDNFTGPNGTLLTAHTPDKVPAGSAWAVANGGPFIIQGNRVVNTQGNDQLTVIDSGISDVDLIVGSVTLGSELAILIRGSGGALNGWLFLCSCARDAFELYRLNGAYNLVDSDASVLTPGDVLSNLELRASGTTIEGLVNGVVKVSTVSAVYQAQTHVGIFLYGDDGTANFDQLSAGAL